MHTGWRTSQYLSLFFIIRLQEEGGFKIREKQGEKWKSELEREQKEKIKQLGVFEDVGVRVGVCVCVWGAHRCVHVHDHLAPGFVALPVVGSFLLLLQHAVPGGSVLQSELAEDFAEAVDADLPHAVGWMAEVQQEGVEPEQGKVTGTPGNSLQHEEEKNTTSVLFEPELEQLIAINCDKSIVEVIIN